MKIVISLLLLILLKGNVYCQTGWFQQNTGTSSEIFSLHFLNSNFGIATVATGRIIKTTNGGESWQIINLNEPYNFPCIYIMDEQKIFIGKGSNRSILKTSNGGINWVTQVLDNTNGGPIFKIQFINSNTGFCAAGYRIIKTIDGGNNWSFTTINNLVGDLVDISMTNDLIGYAMSTIPGSSGGAKIYKTSNGGEEWNMIYSITGAGKSISFVNTTTGYCVGSFYTSSTNNKIYYTNNGSSFNSYNLEEMQQAVKRCFFVNPSVGWILSGSGIKNTTNGGFSFSEYTKFGYFNDVYFVNQFTGWIVGENGKIFKTIDGGSISIRQLSSEIPTKSNLHQNYPNPFNPSTRIEYEVRNNEFVKMHIYNSKGQKIETLVNEKQSAGLYEVSFNGTNYPSGIYFYRLETASFNDTKKMILFK